MRIRQNHNPRNARVGVGGRVNSGTLIKGRGNRFGGPSGRGGGGNSNYITPTSTERQAREVLRQAHASVMAEMKDTKYSWSSNSLIVIVPLRRKDVRSKGGKAPAYSQKLYFIPKHLMMRDEHGESGFLKLQQTLLEYYQAGGEGSETDRFNAATAAYEGITQPFFEALVNCLHDEHPLSETVAYGYQTRHQSESGTDASDFASAWDMVMGACAQRELPSEHECRGAVQTIMKLMLGGRGCEPR